MKTIGLIAGQGELPATVADAARLKGLGVVVAALDSLADRSIASYADAVEWFNVGKVGAVIKFLKKHSVDGVMFAGKVPKTLLYAGGVRPDLKAVGMLMKLATRGDDTILEAVNAEFEREGFTVLDLKGFVPELFTPEGALTRKGPGARQWKDVEFGFGMAREIGRLDIGQTVVVKDLAVMAVEAIEGTDEAVRRGGKLSGGGAVVVKVSRPGQDMRYDVPLVGTDTLRAMSQSGAVVLALEAGRSIVLKREKFIGRAEEYGISVVGVSEGSFKRQAA
jgi:hypothetical protein